jgi:hypothetical protein
MTPTFIMMGSYCLHVMAQNTTDPRTDRQKIEMAQHFDDFEHEYREDPHTDAEVVYEDDQVVVVADHTGQELNEWATDLEIDRSELSEMMHQLARQVCDHDWSVSDPVVFDKLED